MMARIIIVGAGSAALAGQIATLLADRDDVVAEIKAAEPLGEGAYPSEAFGPATSTHGHKVGDRVRYNRKDEKPLYGRVIDLLNGHAVVQFDEHDHATVMIGATMYNLVTIEEPKADPAPWATVPEVASKDGPFDPLEAAQNMLENVADGDVVAVALVGITSAGAVRLYGSESTGQTLNMLAQGIQLADGTLVPADPEDD